MDLKTSYLGLELPHPIVAAASPLTATVEGVLKLEDCGAAAVVMPSIYEEQIRNRAAGGPDAQLGLLRRAAERARIPVIASLNGARGTGWTGFAQELEEAGAAAVELNLYDIPADPDRSGAEIEAGYLDVIRSVREAVTLPVSVKLSPFFSAPGNMIRRTVAAGADGVVLFNRFCEPDIDLAKLSSVPDLELSTPYDMRLPMTWIALVSSGFGGSIAASGGVEGAGEVVKYLLVGADAVMTASALLRHGPEHVETLVSGLLRWMDEHEISSLTSLRGLLAAGQGKAGTEAFLRAQYREILSGDYRQGFGFSKL